MITADDGVYATCPACHSKLDVRLHCKTVTVTCSNGSCSAKILMSATGIHFEDAVNALVTKFDTHLKSKSN